MDSLKDWPSKRNTRNIFWLSLALAIVFNVVTAKQLALSDYPEKSLIGPFPSWWFTFSDTTLKSHYSVMEEQGSLDVFVNVQYLDFGLMISTGIFLFLLAVIVARRQSEDSSPQKLGFAAAFMVAFSSISDFFENIVLLVMLSDHQQFPSWMAVLYSGLASVKVGLITPALFIIVTTGLLYAVKQKSRES